MQSLKREEFNFDFLDRQKQIIRQHICSLSDQDCQKLTQMSSAEMRQYFSQRNLLITGKSLSEALLFAEHGENMLCTKIVLNVRSNFCTQHVLPRFELGIFMY